MKTRVLVMVAVVALAVAACGGGDDAGSTTGDGEERTAPTVGASAEAGKAIYDGTCVACHADGGVGIDGLGKPLAGSDFVNATGDSELVTFIKVGRDTSDPENTSGVAMPAKGGNPSLSDADLESVVAYLRSLN